ncbi:MAG: hypothetical protein LBR33_04625 [Propionibacteriaceae bacterium]|jgi:hypothetical protein|nr:hypothetical protein [Propionibacteriaceae bacterium]
MSFPPTVRSAPYGPYYRVRTQARGWLPSVRSIQDYAGVFGDAITGLCIYSGGSLDGEVEYAVRRRPSNTWLPTVHDYNANVNDYNNGFAGDQNNNVNAAINGIGIIGCGGGGYDYHCLQNGQNYIYSTTGTNGTPPQMSAAPWLHLFARIHILGGGWSAWACMNAFTSAGMPRIEASQYNFIDGIQMGYWADTERLDGPGWWLV